MKNINARSAPILTLAALSLAFALLVPAQANGTEPGAPSPVTAAPVMMRFIPNGWAMNPLDGYAMPRMMMPMPQPSVIWVPFMLLPVAAPLPVAPVAETLPTQAPAPITAAPALPPITAAEMATTLASPLASKPETPPTPPADAATEAMPASPGAISENAPAAPVPNIKLGPVAATPIVFLPSPDAQPVGATHVAKTPPKKIAAAKPKAPHLTKASLPKASLKKSKMCWDKGVVKPC
ncbi:MAG: hypothetical protein ABL892_07640 [Thiobacillaceae bacterium]